MPTLLLCMFIEKNPMWAICNNTLADSLAWQLNISYISIISLKKLQYSKAGKQCVPVHIHRYGT